MALLTVSALLGSLMNNLSNFIKDSFQKILRNSDTELFPNLYIYRIISSKNLTIQLFLLLKVYSSPQYLTYLL